MQVLPQCEVATDPLQCLCYSFALEGKCVAFCLQGFLSFSDDSRNADFAVFAFALFALTGRADLIKLGYAEAEHLAMMEIVGNVGVVTT